MNNTLTLSWERMASSCSSKVVYFKKWFAYLSFKGAWGIAKRHPFLLVRSELILFPISTLRFHLLCCCCFMLLLSDSFFLLLFFFLLFASFTLPLPSLFPLLHIHPSPHPVQSTHFDTPIVY